MIRRIHIENFKSLADVTVDLGPFTVLIGRNGSGKSAFLQALSVLSWLVRYRSINETFVREGVNFNEIVFAKAHTRSLEWECDVEIPLAEHSEPTVLTYGVWVGKRRHVHVSYEHATLQEDYSKDKLPPAESPFLGRISRKFAIAREGSRKVEYKGAVIAHSMLQEIREQTALDARPFPLLGGLAAQLAGFHHFQIWGPEPLRLASVAPATSLSENGANLPSVIAGIRTQPESFAAFTKEMRAIYPRLEEIELRHAPVHTYALSFLERAATTGKRVRFSAAQMSDGFLRVLALTALKYQTGRIPILGYEEPENGLHPQALEDCVRRLRDIAKAGTQVIVTTHSPYLLDYLMDGEDEDLQPQLRVVVRQGDDPTQILPVAPEKLAEARSHGIGAGELWSLLVDELELVGGKAR